MLRAGQETCWLMFMLLLLMMTNGLRSVGSESEQEQENFFKDDLSKFNLLPRHSSFPMLYFDDDELESFRIKALSTHAHITKELREATEHIRATPGLQPPRDVRTFGAEWNEVYGNNLPVLGLVQALFPNKDLLTYIFNYMDTMVHYSSWQVNDLPNDEVPIAHSLVGFATAYDFIYNHLDLQRKDRYVKKIRDITLSMFIASQRRSWGHYYLQNHQATNVVGLLIGSLITETQPQYRDEAQTWKRRAVVLYERTMTLLKGIDDGSLDEGAGYVGYTLRSLSQYVYLVRRHFGYDHSHHPWLQRHFEYIYLTILPGLGRTVGIADCPQAWFYGPESQLHFLDKFVLRDGRANWLAAQIKENKLPLMKGQRLERQRYTTLHTEFIFYDPTITPRPPDGYNLSQLHTFTDWGVTTYRGGAITNPSSTFFSFKSSKIHGKYVYKIANTVHDDQLQGWRAFNPGHEHPDQNSFTLWFKGEPFVSDGLYGPKLPYLDNVLMFKEKSQGRKDSPSCMYPWVGQLGACKQWLEWKGAEERFAHGRIIMSLEESGNVFVAGESTGAYTKSLGLKHIFRSTLLIQNRIFVVFDNVRVSEDSRVSHVAAFFNNFQHRFRQTKHKTTGLSGFTLVGDPEYLAFWVSVNGESPPANITHHNYTSADRPLLTSNANVTFKVEDSQATFAFVFIRPGVLVEEFGIYKPNSKEVYALLKTDNHEYKILVALNPLINNGRPVCTVHDVSMDTSTEFYHKMATNLKTSNNSSPGGLSSRSLTLEAKFVFIAVNIAAIIGLRIKFGKRQRTWTSKKWTALYFLMGFILSNILFMV